jgi:hypothetical protein
LPREEWEKLRYSVYEALLPALNFQRTTVYILAGLFAWPVLSFLFLVSFVKTDYLTLQTNTDDNDEGGQDEEYLFEMLLIVATLGCLGLAFLVLTIGSLTRRYYVDNFVELSAQRAICDFLEQSRHVSHLLSLDIQHEDTLDAPSSSSSRCCSSLRTTFLAWFDVDFVLIISYERGHDFGQTSYEQHYSTYAKDSCCIDEDIEPDSSYMNITEQ